MSVLFRSPIVLAAAAALALVAWRGSALGSASRRASAARDQLAEVTQQAQEVLDLRAKRPTTGMGPKPADDLTKLVTATMKDAGIAPERLRSVSPDTESTLPPDPLWPGVTRRRQTARVAIEPMTPGELGVLLRAWQRGQSVWSVTVMDLSKLGGPAGGGADATYRVHLSLASTYVDGPKRP